jgi:hypothetical protein
MIFFDQWGGPKLVPVSATGTWPAPMIRLDVRKDRLLPAFNRSRAGGFRSGKVRFSRLNLEYRWADPVDTPQRAEVSLWRVGERSGRAADVTLRRLRKFQAAAGKTYAWKMGEQNGEVTADEDGLITIRALALPTAPARLVVTAK